MNNQCCRQRNDSLDSFRVSNSRIWTSTTETLLTASNPVAKTQELIYPTKDPSKLGFHNFWFVQANNSMEEKLSDDLVLSILGFVGAGCYRFVGAINRRWNKLYPYASMTSLECGLSTRRTLMMLIKEHEDYTDEQLELIGRKLTMFGKLDSMQWLDSRYCFTKYIKDKSCLLYTSPSPRD